MNNVYVRGFVPYVSGKTEEEALLAGPPREGSKIGGFALKKGTTLEQAKKVFTYGKDYSNMLTRGDLKDDIDDNEFIYHITKASKAKAPAPAPEAVLQA